MVRQFLSDHFGMGIEDAEVLRHDPEDFVVRFRRREDRDVHTPAVGAQFSLLWRLWRRTSLASGGVLQVPCVGRDDKGAPTCPEGLHSAAYPWPSLCGRAGRAAE